MIKAAAYVRFSSSQQREESIDAQLRAINDYAESNGYRIIMTYEDRAQSARSDDRPQFQQMVSDAALGAFSAVLVHKLDRFSRDRYDSAVYRRRLRKCGVTLVSVLERLDGSPESIILESVIDGMAEYYSKNLAREVKKGMDENARKAKHNGGRPALGYRVNDDMEYEIEPFEAETVRKIFSMYVQHHSYDEIIAEMNRQGRKTKAGKPFGRNSIHEILKNQKYIGVYLFNRRYKSKETGKSNMHLNRKEEDIIMIEDGVPRIIDDETWDKAQERIHDRKHKAAYKRKTRYLLSGLIYCGNCGAKMNGNSRYSHKRKDGTYYISYICSKSCGASGVKRDDVEKAVVQDMKERLFSVKGATRVAEDVIEAARAENKTLPDRIAETRALYMEADKKVMDIVHAVESGLFRPEMKEAMQTWGDRKDALKEELDMLEATSEGMSLATRDRIIEWLVSHNKYLDNENDRLQAICKQFIESVTVQETGIEVKYKLLSMPVFTNGRGEPCYTVNTVIPRYSSM